MIRQPSSLDRLDGPRMMEAGRVVMRLDTITRGRTITSRLYEAHARRVIEARTLMAGDEAMATVVHAR